MKYLILFYSILFFSFSESPSDFDYKLSNIVRAFKQGILDSNECEKQKREVQYLINDIEEAIEDEDEFTMDEIKSLKNLKKEAQAIEDYISSVGNIGNYVPTIENLYLANKRVGGSISNVTNGEFCVDIISVTIGDYIAYLAKNNSTKNFKVTYKWKGNNGMNTGSGDMGLSYKSVRHIYDNREDVNLKKINVFSLTCKEF